MPRRISSALARAGVVRDPRAAKYRSASDCAPTRAATAVAMKRFKLIPATEACLVCVNLSCLPATEAEFSRSSSSQSPQQQTRPLGAKSETRAGRLHVLQVERRNHVGLPVDRGFHHQLIVGMSTGRTPTKVEDNWNTNPSERASRISITSVSVACARSRFFGLRTTELVLDAAAALKAAKQTCRSTHPERVGGTPRQRT